MVTPASIHYYMLAALLLTSQTLRVLFVGNSLLNFNDVPGIAAKMLESDGSNRKVSYKSYFVPHLEDIPAGSQIDSEVTSGPYDVVVLQAAMVSSSMTRTYRQDRAIAMAKMAKAKGKRVILYVEWPRRGIDETEFTLNVYRGIAKASGAELLPICYAWNEVHRRAPKIEVWSPDGNHATLAGSTLAAYCLYFRLAGVDRKPSFLPKGVDATFGPLALGEALRLERSRQSVAKG